MLKKHSFKPAGPRNLEIINGHYSQLALEATKDVESWRKQIGEKWVEEKVVWGATKPKPKK